MAKQPSDLTIEGHINGDADGLGSMRGVLSCLAIEGIAVIAFGVFLFYFWS